LIKYSRCIAQILVLLGLAFTLSDPTPGRDRATLDSLRGWTALELTGSRYLVAVARSRLARWPATGEEKESLLRVDSTVSVFGASTARHQVNALASGTPPSTTRWTEIQRGKRARATRVTTDRIVAQRYRLPDGADLPVAGNWGTPEKAVAVPMPTTTKTACGKLDPYTLLMNLECLARAPGNSVLLLTRKGAAVLSATVKETTTESLLLEDLDSGERIEARLQVQRLELVREEGGNEDETAFGMVGRVSVWIDRASGAVIAIEGEHEKIPGTIRLDLNGISRKPAPRPALPWPPADPATLDAGRRGP